MSLKSFIPHIYSYKDDPAPGSPHTANVGSVRPATIPGEGTGIVVGLHDGWGGGVGVVVVGLHDKWGGDEGSGVGSLISGLGGSVGVVGLGVSLGVVVGLHDGWGGGVGVVVLGLHDKWGGPVDGGDEGSSLG